MSTRRPSALPRAMALELARARYERGWSQAALARRVGVHYTALCGWENGRRSPSLEHLIAWAGALGRTLTFAPEE